MTSKKIPDFTETELSAVTTTLEERYGRLVDIQLADSELRLSPHSHDLTSCPTIYWEAEGCHFVLCKTGEKSYRSQFFYSVREEYGTGRTDYDDILDCVVSLLRAQADHDLERQAGG